MIVDANRGETAAEVDVEVQDMSNLTGLRDVAIVGTDM